MPKLLTKSQFGVSEIHACVGIKYYIHELEQRNGNEYNILSRRKHIFLKLRTGLLVKAFRFDAKKNRCVLVCV